MLKLCTVSTTDLHRGLHCNRAEETHQKESDAVNILHEIDCPDIMLGYVAQFGWTAVTFSSSSIAVRALLSPLLYL